MKSTGRIARTRRGLRVVYLSAFSVAWAGATALTRADRTYIGPASGVDARWNVAANWSPAGLPAAEMASISNADLISRTVLFDTNAAITTLEINQTGVGAVNTLSQTHASGFGLNATISEIIGSTGSGAYIQSTGTNETPELALGQFAGSNGTYTLEDGTLSANRVAGVSGNGTFIQTGGINKGVVLYIGLNGGSNGSYSISGGSASANIIVVADQIGSVGSMTVSGDATVQSDILRIGNNGAASFTQAGGGVSTTALDGVSAAAQAGSTATVALSGGTLDTQTFAIGGTGLTIGGIGTATIGGTAAVTVAGTLHLWGQPLFGIDSSTLDMTAGTLTTGAIDLHGAPGRFTWTGGTLHVTSSQVTVGPPPDFSGGLTEGQIGPSRVIGPNQQLITGSAAQVAALEFWGVDVSGSDTVRADLQIHGGQVNLFGTFVVGDDAFFRMSSGALNSLVTHVGGAAGTATTGGTAMQTGGTHTADLTPIASVPELQAQGLSAFLLALNPGSVGTYTLSGTGVLNAIGGAALGGRIRDDGIVFPGGAGTLNVSGGTMNITNGGLLAIAGTGSRINLSGGRINTETISLDGDFAALNWTGGTLAITGAGPFDIGSGGPIGMSLSMTPGKTLEVSNALRATSGGAILLAGGHVKAVSLDLGGDASRLHWSGGKLELTGAGGITVGATSPAGATMTIPAGGTLDTALFSVLATGTTVVHGNVVASQVENSGDLRLGGDGARVDTRLPLTALFQNFKLLRGDGQVDLNLRNQPDGEIRATGDEALRFTGADNTNSGRINLVNGGTADFVIGLTNNADGQITGRGTLMAGTVGLSNNGSITFSGDSSAYGDITQSTGAKLITTGNSTVTYYGDIAGPAGSEIRTSAGSTAIFLGSATGDFTGGGTKVFDGPMAEMVGAGAIASLIGDTVVESNVLATHVREDELEVYGRLRIAPNGTAGGTSRVNALTVGSGAKLDLADNKLIVAGGDAGSFNGASYTALAGLVDSGRGNAGNALWNGDGIVTSDTRAISNGDLLSIGVAKVSEVRSVSDSQTTTFAGQTVAGSDALLMVTWGGDANLDGKINIDDYGRIDGNVGQSGSVFGWFNGDFNYDGKINIDDYGIIDGNINRQGAPFATAGVPASVGAGLDGVSAVPEPAILSLLALVPLCRRQRGRGARFHLPRWQQGR